MIKNFFIVLLFIVIGCISTTGAYVFVTHKELPLLSPLSQSHFSLDQAPSNSLVGNISTLTGSVFWLSRTAHSPVAITKPQQIQQGEELQTENGEVTLQFSQTATIDIRKNSHISVIQTLPANTVIQQKLGTVDYTGLSTSMPISVRGLGLLISFSKAQATISVDPTTSLITVAANTGTIQAAYTNANNTTKVVQIAEGKKLVFNNDTQEVQN